MLRAVEVTDTSASIDDDQRDDQRDEQRVMIADRYELVTRIGKGATGSVYRAYDRTLAREVAIKLLAPGELALAEREAQVLAKITHRNVVTIHDYGRDLGHELSHHYLVLELLDGVDFATWLRTRPPAAEVIERFVEAGHGLEAAHRAGLIHRDFKPSNVILTKSGRVVVIDFGLAQTVDAIASPLDINQFTEGTLAYMAPERLAGYESDERSDQFSFCVALWEGLAGSNPFTGADPLARYRSIRNGPVRSSAQREIEASRQMLATLERGLSFDREQRFSTMSELLTELRRPSSSDRGHRRPWLTAVGMVGVFLLGWGMLPEGPTIEAVHSSLDPRADAAMAMLESATMRVESGDNRAALNDVMVARELVADAPRNDQYCAFGGALPDLADAMASNQGINEARMVYAIALRFAKDCPSLTKEDLLARRESARATASFLEP